jgi:hypothetical protein
VYTFVFTIANGHLFYLLRYIKTLIHLFCCFASGQSTRSRGTCRPRLQQYGSGHVELPPLRLHHHHSSSHEISSQAPLAQTLLVSLLQPSMQSQVRQKNKKRTTKKTTTKHTHTIMHLVFTLMLCSVSLCLYFLRSLSIFQGVDWSCWHGLAGKACSVNALVQFKKFFLFLIFALRHVMFWHVLIWRATCHVSAIRSKTWITKSNVSEQNVRSAHRLTATWIRWKFFGCFFSSSVVFFFVCLFVCVCVCVC